MVPLLRERSSWSPIIIGWCEPHHSNGGEVLRTSLTKKRTSPPFIRLTSWYEQKNHSQCALKNNIYVRLSLCLFKPTKSYPIGFYFENHVNGKPDFFPGQDTTYLSYESSCPLTQLECVNCPIRIEGL